MYAARRRDRDFGATTRNPLLLMGEAVRAPDKETTMKKITTKKLSLNAEKIAVLDADALREVGGGLMLTRPYTKVSVCAGGGACASEVCQ